MYKLRDPPPKGDRELIEREFLPQPPTVQGLGEGSTPPRVPYQGESRKEAQGSPPKRRRPREAQGPKGRSRKFRKARAQGNPRNGAGVRKMHTGNPKNGVGIRKTPHRTRFACRECYGNGVLSIQWPKSAILSTICSPEVAPE